MRQAGCEDTLRTKEDRPSPLSSQELGLLPFTPELPGGNTYSLLAGCLFAWEEQNFGFFKESLLGFKCKSFIPLLKLLFRSLINSWAPVGECLLNFPKGFFRLVLNEIQQGPPAPGHCVLPTTTPIHPPQIDIGFLGGMRGLLTLSPRAEFYGKNSESK